MARLIFPWQTNGLKYKENELECYFLDGHMAGFIESSDCGYYWTVADPEFAPNSGIAPDRSSAIESATAMLVSKGFVFISNKLKSMK